MLARRKPQRSGIRDADGPLRSPRHLKFVRGFQCCCGRPDIHFPGERIEAAHVRIGTDGSLSQKPSDVWAVPLAQNCHVRQHTGERTFWRLLGLNPHRIAIELARKSPDLLVREFAKGMTDRW